MSIANKIMNFIKDERGAESIEYALTSTVIGAGVAVGLTQTKDLLQAKSADMRAAINVDPSLVRYPIDTTTRPRQSAGSCSFWCC